MGGAIDEANEFRSIALLVFSLKLLRPRRRRLEGRSAQESTLTLA